MQLYYGSCGSRPVQGLPNSLEKTPCPRRRASCGRKTPFHRRVSPRPQPQGAPMASLPLTRASQRQDPPAQFCGHLDTKRRADAKGSCRCCTPSLTMHAGSAMIVCTTSSADTCAISLPATLPPPPARPRSADTLGILSIAAGIALMAVRYASSENYISNR